ncbi:uncharacterized protein BO87DRAFT_2261 [Aspergillus neoniger CBS 115656]|uniref:Uncharacterized protein n=1 Tax=Aspergillus neoniger (strain CBS 115656) TaxID=1448310 RepID=A0A318YYB1_ASPNB|nr:hypothetical protein BO87DRAFT_2261 [Aspergillus neoniger CBS 115656]PYH39569.1 hypothetical protein BO87DRAFT_2261 [Aspergillus neoniger CBS 115656]
MWCPGGRKLRGSAHSRRAREMRKCQSGRAPHPNFLWASGCGAAADVRAFAGFYLTMKDHYYSYLHGAQLAVDTDPPLETKKTLPGSRCHSFLHTGSPRVKGGVNQTTTTTTTATTTTTTMSWRHTSIPS